MSNPTLDLRSVPTLAAILETISKDPSLGEFHGGEPTLKPQRLWMTTLNYVVQLGTSTGEDRNLYIKMPRDREDPKDEFSKTCRLRSLFKSASPQFDCVEPLTYYETPKAIVFRACRGESFFDKIRKSCSWMSGASLADALNASEAVGRWLRYLETVSWRDQYEPRAWKTIKVEALTARDTIKRKGSSVWSNELADLCLQTISSASVEASREIVYLAHGDFHPQNVFIEKGTKPLVTAIDCKLSNTRLIGHDALTLQFYLTNSFGPHRYAPWRIRRVWTSFLVGYGRELNLKSDLIKCTRALLLLNYLVFLTTSGKRSSGVTLVSKQLDRLSLKRWFRRYILIGAGHVER